MTISAQAASQAETHRDASRLCLRLAGITLALSSADAGLRMQVAGPMSKFLCAEETAPDMTIRVAWAELDQFDYGQKIFDSGGIWQLFAEPEGYLFRLAAPFSDWSPYKLARFDSNWTSGEILCQHQYFNPDEALYPLEYPLDELLFSNLLAQGRGIEIHGCGLRDADGRGYLFAGQSGAGKSTAARLWQQQQGVQLLSDERVILRQVGQQFFIYGTPWHGDARLAQAGSAPLDKIFFLRHGAQHELVPQGKADAAARLFSCSFPPFYSHHGLEFTLEFLDHLTEAVPCAELSFVPEASLVEFIRCQSHAQA